MRHLNLIYLLGELRASHWDNNEIRYSLRSFDTLFALDWVGIVGPEVPSFLTGVTHIPAELGPVKYKNLIRQLHTAMNDPRTPEDLILMNDDFYMRGTPEWDWTPTHMGVIESREKMRHWTQTVVATGTWLKEQGIDGDLYSYEGHTPMPIKKSLAAEVLAKMIPVQESLQFRTAYGNYWRIGGKKHTNAKHRRIEHWPADSPFFSSKSYPTDEVKKYIAEWLPVPSRFEQGGSNGVSTEDSQPNP